MKVLTVDLDKCQASQACMTACAKALFKTEQRTFSAVQVERRAQGVHFAACDQCGECIRVCPTLALYRAKTGVVMLKKDLCVGCLMCIGFCPSASMFKVPEAAEPMKCISCGNCVKACPSGALSMVQKDHAHLPA